ncbi:MAG: aminoacyl-tRNA hydrolase [Candidatus Absconditabacterales bacterium]|nr:aminoacyl-tRNA hydrolase [Candidatus Absconditabacterales bacterium]
MKLIVGLGNPGEKYVKTRHNIGFFFLNQFVESNSFGDFVYDNKYGAEILQINYSTISGEQKKILFIKPMEYMNRSGNAVGKIMNFYKIDAKDLLVIHDDIDLMVGKVQFKFGGGLAGHNGLKDIAEKLGTKDFARIRIGVDRPAIQSQVSDYVLSSFKKEEIEKIQDKYLEFEKIVFEVMENE